jgi:hypothetical protein
MKEKKKKILRPYWIDLRIFFHIDINGVLTIGIEEQGNSINRGFS